MQVSLDAVDWAKLTSFPSPAEFLEWYDELEDESEFGEVSCYDRPWSDSAHQYMAVAEVIDHLISISDPETSGHLRQGIRRLVCESGQVDELGMGAATEGCTWISASPETTATIKGHIDAVDLDHCVALLRGRPAPVADEIMAELDAMFVDFIAQHARMVDTAVSLGYGLLGHCG